MRRGKDRQRERGREGEGQKALLLNLERELSLMVSLSKQIGVNDVCCILGVRVSAKKAD